MYLTARQLDVVDFVHEFQRKRRISPTLSEIAFQLGVSKITAHEHLNQLERKGVIRRAPRRARSVELLVAPPPKGENVVTVAAELEDGRRVAPAVEEFAIGPEGLLPPGPAFQALRVRGGALLREGLVDGDLLFVDMRQPRDGDPVLVELPDGQVALGRLRLDPLGLEPLAGGRAVPLEAPLRPRGVLQAALRRFS